MILKKVLQNILVQLLGRGAVILAAVATTIVLTRSLGVNRFGDYVFLTSFWLFLVALSDWGTQIIGVRELSKRKSAIEKSAVFASLTRLRFYLLGGSLLIGLAAIFIFPVFSDLQRLAFLSLLTVIVTTFQTNFLIAFQAFLLFSWQALVEVLGTLLFLFLVIAGLHFGWGLGGVMVALVVGRLLSVFVAAARAKKLPIWGDKGNTHLLRLLWREALPAGGLLFVNTAYDRLIDTSLLHYFWEAKTVGIYGLAYKTYANLILPAYYIARSIFPMISRQSGKKSEAFKLGIRLALIASFLISGTTFIFAPLMIRILGGASFSLATPILRLLALSLPFTYLNHIFGFSLIAAGFQWQSFLISLIALLFNLLGNWWLIPHFSAFGAAGVTAATEALTCLLSSLFLFYGVFLQSKKVAS